jgi:hypothetical protein
LAGQFGGLTGQCLGLVELRLPAISFFGRRSREVGFGSV